jgi:3-deoxy-D-arabino-heptulosonate 7-phosphate (DAHP) synthase class II
MADRSLELTREEYLVLIELLNKQGDQGRSFLKRTLPSGEEVFADLLPLIWKVIQVGERNGWVVVPSNCPLTH